MKNQATYLDSYKGTKFRNIFLMQKMCNFFHFAANPISTFPKKKFKRRPNEKLSNNIFGFM